MTAAEIGRGTMRGARAGAAIAALGGLYLSACTVGPDYKPPSAHRLGVPSDFSASIPAGAEAPSEEELATWWAALGDPVLDRLVTAALTANPDIDAAGARLRQARASYKGARASLFPSLTASASAGHTSVLGNGNGALLTAPGGTGVGAGGGGSTLFATRGSYEQYDAGLDAAYEVDLFGGVRRSVEAARGDYASAAENLRDTQRTVVAEVALNYVDAREAQERLTIARSTLKSEDETVQIAGWRGKAGLVSGLDLAQARALREQTAATVPSLETGFTQSANALAILTGQAPGAVTGLLDPAKPIPAADRALGADVPTAVLAQRPDVRAAERTLAAATARIGVAKAQLYPALRLSGTLGGNGTSIGDISRFSTGSLIAALSAPIFDGGQIRSQIETARGGADLALAQYRSAVLTALSDVENALVALANSRRRVVTLAAATDDSHAALVFSRSQYRAGLIDFQTLLDTQRTYLSSADSLAQARADRATGLIQLYKALGGGWQAAPVPGTAFPNVPAIVELDTADADTPPPAETADAPAAPDKTERP